MKNVRRAIPAAQFIAVAEADGARAKPVASELEVQHYFVNVEDLLKCEDIQAVVVATPSRFQASVRQLAAVPGKHVFCEKPPDLLMEDAESARTEVVGSKGAFQIGYLRQTAQLVLTGAGASYETVDHWLGRFADAYLNELRDFEGAVLKEKPTQVEGKEGFRAIAVCLAGERSHRESRPVTFGIERKI